MDTGTGYGRPPSTYLRELTERQLEVIKAGGEPINVSHDEDAPPARFEAGNFLRDG